MFTESYYESKAFSVLYIKNDWLYILFKLSEID